MSEQPDVRALREIEIWRCYKESSKDHINDLKKIISEKDEEIRRLEIENEALAEVLKDIFLKRAKEVDDANS